ncbi:MAG: tripartite tricarboxylate transporter substrate binding protein [Xanthobacteraceae bacterium]
MFRIARGTRALKASTLVAVMAASSAFAAPDAMADDYPARPIRIVVGFTAGGPTDIPIRFLADKLGNELGKPVVVENKPGAGSMLATYDVLNQPRDGYTLLACTYFDPVNTLLYKDAHYKVSDIAPVSLIARYDYAIAVSNNNPAKTFAELVQYGKANPGKLNYGHLGIGSSQNLVAKRLEKVTGISMTGIPYKGAADALHEVASGRLDLFVGPPFAVMPLYEGKQVKVLAVTGKERLASAPDVPTLTESGIPIVSFAWLGICAGAGTPQPVIDLLNSKITPILKSDAYRALLATSGSVPMSSTPQEMQDVIDDTVKQAAPLVDEFDLHLN